MGRYIALEGIDGAGKSTVILLLAQMLLAKKNSVAIIKEPWDFSAPTIADANLKGYAGFVIDRGKLLPQVEQLCKKMDFVLSDRCFMSSMVYNDQDEVSMDTVLVDHAHHKWPDLIIVLRPDMLTAADRSGEKVTDLETLRDKYDIAAKRLGKRCLVVNINPEQKATSVAMKLMEKLVDPVAGRL